jgi:clan AA aspartic protease (TIGR02281 family)
MLRAHLHHYTRVVAWIPWAVLAGFIAAAVPVFGGEMYRWVDEQGQVHLTDTPPKSRQGPQDLKVYRPGERPAQPDSGAAPNTEPGRAKLMATKPGGVITVEASLNRRLTVPLLLDTGADLTVLTKQAAADLRILGLNRLPTLQFSTAGGMVHLPITTLRSLRVGTAEVRDVEVAIDVDGHLPVGLLGMSFLRHFKVTVDQQRGQVAFER